jgi:hypothetical protein
MTTITDPDCHPQDQAWMFYELSYVRREAQSEADVAYEMWCRLPGRDGYAVYRAAQDRADIAQDQLAAWVCDRVAPLFGC